MRRLNKELAGLALLELGRLGSIFEARLMAAGEKGGLINVEFLIPLVYGERFSHVMF